MLHTRIYCVSYYYYYITEEYLVGINPSAECVFRDWTGRGVCAVLYKRINGYEWLWSVSSLSLSLCVYTYLCILYININMYILEYIPSWQQPRILYRLLFGNENENEQEVFRRCGDFSIGWANSSLVCLVVHIQGIRKQGPSSIALLCTFSTLGPGLSRI